MLDLIKEFIEGAICLAMICAGLMAIWFIGCSMI